LLIFVHKEGFSSTGKRESPEVYCAEVCREIFEIIERCLVGAGTVKFPEVTVDTIEDLDTKCLVVNLKEYRANPGVLISNIIEQDETDTEEESLVEDETFNDTAMEDDFLWVQE
jgi:hypothetical protein